MSGFYRNESQRLKPSENFHILDLNTHLEKDFL
jgi:hypothetical protein